MASGTTMTIDDWIAHWREKLDALVAARKTWDQVDSATGPAATARKAELDVRIAHHKRLIEGLLDKQRRAAV